MSAGFFLCCERAAQAPHILYFSERVIPSPLALSPYKNFLRGFACALARIMQSRYSFVKVCVPRETVFIVFIAFIAVPCRPPSAVVGRLHFEFADVCFVAYNG